MSNGVVTQIAGLSQAEIRPIIRAVLGEDARPVGQLAATKIGRSAGHGTAGIFHVSGHAQTSAGQTTWSAVVKALGVPEHPSPDAPENPLREIKVYESRVFANLCGGVRAAHYYGLQEQDGVQFLWLEDLTQAPQPPWHAQQFTEAARHLGQFNGHWSAAQLPDWNWLSQLGFRSRFHNSNSQQALEQLLKQRDHPLVQRFAPPEVIPALVRLWDESHALLMRAEEMPKGVCHLDCHPKNLFPIHESHNESYTVAIDWVKVGIGSLGIDIGHLLASPMTWLELSPDEAQQLKNPIYAAYMSGLTSTGWSGNEAGVRLTYLTRLACEAIRHIMLIAHAMSNADWAATMERFVGLPITEISGRYGRALEFYFDCKDEALRLARQN